MQRHNRTPKPTDQMQRVSTLAVVALGLALLGPSVGCSGYIEAESLDTGTDNDTRRSPDTGLPGKGDNPSAITRDAGGWSDTGPSQTSCKKTAEKALKVLETNCSSCHGTGSDGDGNIRYVTNPSKLKSKGKVEPYEPENSILYKRMNDGSMPPNSAQTQPNATDIEHVKNWIDCGAPSPNTRRKRIGIDKKLTWMEDDIRSITNTEDRKDIRYISFAHLHNSSMSDKKLEEYRQALFLTLNSLSRSRNIHLPEAVDKDKPVYRIDIDDYAWEPATWSRIVSEYPYAVSYEKDSRTFGYDETAHEILRKETGSAVPYIQADWFITHAMQAPLYYEILELPATLGGLERELGLDLDKNIRNAQVDRAGFTDSGVSDANRIIERHELGADGSFWISYDFVNSQGDSNIFTNPFKLAYENVKSLEGEYLTFQEDGGEMIFTLENGLQGYFITNAAGERLNKAPNNVVTHQDRPDNQVQAGVSCMGCHNAKGLIPKDDEIRKTAGDFAAPAREKILERYPEKSTFANLRKQDADQFLDAKEATGVDPSLDEPVMRVVLDHEGSLSLSEAARALGLPASRLGQELDTLNSLSINDLQPVRTLTNGGKIDREVFDSIVHVLVCAIGLGDPVAVDRHGNAHERQCTDLLRN